MLYRDTSRGGKAPTPGTESERAVENLEPTDEYDPAEDYSADADGGVDVGDIMSPWTLREVAHIYGATIDEVAEFLETDIDPDTTMTLAEVELLDLAWINRES